MVVRFVLTIALAAGVALAQGGRGGGGGMGGDEGGMGGGMGGGGGMGAGGMGGGAMPRAQRANPVQQFMEKLKLNKDQKEETVKLLSDEAQKVRPIAEQVTRGRQVIATAMLQNKSEQEMKPLMDAYTSVSAQMTAAEAEVFGKIYATLKPNQQKNAPQAFELLGGIFMPTVASGRSMGRGQGAGGGSRQGSRGGRN